MSKEGYLLVHEEGRRSTVQYAVLGEGKLQFFSKRDRGVQLREVVLSRSRLKIRGVPDDEGRNCPYSFSVRLQRSRIRDGRLLVFGAPLLLVLSAPSWGERKAWGNAIHAWQRNYWGEPQHKALGLADDELDVFFDTQFKALQLALQTAAVPLRQQQYQSHSQPKQSRRTSASTAAQKASAATRAAARVPRALFGRAQAVKNMGSRVGKKLRSSSVTFSLPPMGLSVSTSVQQPPTR